MQARLVEKLTPGAPGAGTKAGSLEVGIDSKFSMTPSKGAEALQVVPLPAKLPFSNNRPRV